MDSHEIKTGKSLVQNSLKSSAKKLGLPTPIVNWQTQYIRGSTIYTAFIFCGAKQKRLTFLDQELRAWSDDNPQPVIRNRIYDALAK